MIATSTKDNIDLSNSVMILGTEYKIIQSRDDEDSNLIDVDAYVDSSVKKIVVNTRMMEGATIEEPIMYYKKVMRHEIIHAFLEESGLSVQAKWDESHNEQMVDWVAIQFPKMMEVFKKLNLL